MHLSMGERFALAIAERDAAALSALLAPDIDFRGLTPNRAWEAHSPDEVVEVVLGHWFEETDRVRAVNRVELGDGVGDVRRIGYRFDMVCPDGPRGVEQQAYYRVRDDRIGYLRVLCSGFQPRNG